MLDLSAQQITNRSLSSSNSRTVGFQVLKWVTIVGLLVGLQVSYASVKDEILMNNYEVEQLRNSNANLLEDNEELTTRLNALTSPLKVEDSAMKLGLISSNSPQVVILEGDPIPTAQTQLAQSRSRVQPEAVHE